MRVSDLDPGDTVVQFGAEAVFIARTQHPVWRELQLVIWRTDDGTIRLDALHMDHEVGLVVSAATSAGQHDRLLGAVTSAPWYGRPE